MFFCEMIAKDSPTQRGTNSDLVIGISGLNIVCVALLVTGDLNRWSRIFLDWNIVTLGGLALIMIIKELVRPEGVALFESQNEFKNIVVGLTIIAGYVFLIQSLGFLLSSYMLYALFN